MVKSLGSFSWRSRGHRYFDLELGTRHRTYLAPARLALRFLCAGLGIWLAWSATQAVIAWKELQEGQERVDEIRQKDHQLMATAQAEGVDLSEQTLARLPAEVMLANHLLAKRNFSWTQFLSGLEAVIPPQVSVRAVRLDPGNTLIHMTGAAVAVEDVTALTLSLQSHPVFHDPVLGQHHTGGDGLVEFDLTLKYRVEGIQGT